MDDIKVNESEWNSLSVDEREKITGIIGGFFKGARIVPDAMTPVSGVDVKGLGTPFCKLACTIAENAAIGACAGLGNPIAIAACVAAAHLAGDACRRKC